MLLEFKEKLMSDPLKSETHSNNFRRLGETEIHLSPIGLGTWQFSSGVGNLGKFWDPLKSDTMTGIVKTALNSGVNWFDTAESYGDGASERNLSTSLKSLDVTPGNVIIADKWWPKQRKASSIIETIEERLKCLQGYPIDLYQIHWPESESWLRTEMKMLAQLVDEGKVKAVGLCNYNRRDLKRAHRQLRKRGIPLASIQMRYSLAHRDIDRNNIMNVAKDLGVSVIAWSPLEQGLLTGRLHDNPESINNLNKHRVEMFGFSPQRLKQTQELINVLKKVAERHHATPAQISVAWLTQFHGESVFAIPGASSIEQAESNCASMLIKLTTDELGEIDEVSKSL